MGRRMTNAARRHRPLRPGHAWMREARRTGNPLLRKPCRAERLMVMAGLAGLTLAALGVVLLSLHVYLGGTALEQRESSQRSTILATVESDPVTVTMGPQASGPSFASVTYRWLGVSREGMVPVAETARPGNPALVWVDSTGMLTGPPRRHTETLLDAIETGALGVVGLVVLTYHGVCAYQKWSMRRRSALWDTEWLTFVARGPANGV
jgi:hypothetical protein